MSEIAGSTTTSGLSPEEFERIQNQLLDLKTTNYQLIEQCSKKDTELKLLIQKEKTLEDDVFKANATIAKSKRAKDVFTLEQDVEILRLKLNVQEEEFRLQQSTLISELNRVVSQNEQLQKDIKKFENIQSLESSTPLHEIESPDQSDLMNEISNLRTKCAEYARQLQRYSKDNQESGSIICDQDENGSKIVKLQNENDELKSSNLQLRNNLDINKQFQDRIRQQNEELAIKMTYFQQQVAELNEKLRKKQESYQMLNDEKERQYIEYKKSLDNVVRKKDTEISDLLERIAQLKRDFEKCQENKELKLSTLDSTQSEYERMKSVYNEAVEQNEALQMQLLESHSANDCLSAQLQQAKQDVMNMQAEVDEAVGLAYSRKSLVDEMAQHLDAMKDDFKREKESIFNEYANQARLLKSEIDNLSQKCVNVGKLESELVTLQKLSTQKDELIGQLSTEAKDFKLKLELLQAQYDEFFDKSKNEHEFNLKLLQEEQAKISVAYTTELDKLCAENKKLNDLLEAGRQDLKDKQEQLTVLERKHGHVIKDLKKQLQTEKKRADRLQEKFQELSSNENARNRSPGLEDIRYIDVSKESKTNGGDTGSVSSWSVVSANHKDADRHSNGDRGDRESESSVTMLESDNQELIGRIAILQRQNYELTERVLHLEESNAAMADDLMRKTAIIEQFLKEKPLMNVINAPPTPPDHHQMHNRLPGGLKKMIDLVKIDQSAGEIRDMNKRLQLMLEETLTKNMHLQRDLEMMSNEAARLSAYDPEKR